MLKGYIILIIVFASSLTVLSQSIEHTYSDSIVLCKYSMENGLLNGTYSSFYTNGLKKSEGQFHQNNRVGLWTVWDSSGNIRAIRRYKNNLFYKRIQPAMPSDKSIELLNYIPQEPLRNSDSYFDFPSVREKDVFYMKRYIGLISVNRYQNLLPLEELANLFIDNKNNEDFATYHIFENYKKHKLEIENTGNQIIIAFKTKKEFFYDLDRQMSESRLSFLSPVILDTVSGTINDENWYFYPDIHPYLAKLALNLDDKNIDIKNISDIFFWNYYPEVLILKQDYLKGLEIKDIATSTFTNNDEMENLIIYWEKHIINEIENEHNFWIHFTKTPYKLEH